MRINKFIAERSLLSRRAADKAIENGRVAINGKIARLGDTVNDTDSVTLDGKPLSSVETIQTVLLHKPVGYVCSHDGQGSPTVYELLPKQFTSLNIAGRLDKDSSGLVLLTNDGTLLNKLTHPKYSKRKVYEVTLLSALSSDAMKAVCSGVAIGDERPSKFTSIRLIDASRYEVVLSEGRNRQIRRTIQAIGNKVITLHRTAIDTYTLHGLKAGEYRLL